MKALIVLLLLTAPAAAYPHFQRSSGSVRCAQCHISPAGGGVLTAWGIEESGDTLSGGGDGRFLHGAIELPEWLVIGGDARVAALANDVGASDGTELAAFPMQADLAIGVKSGAWTAVGVVGARGRVRSGSPDTMSTANQVEDTSLASYVISREHYIMWRPDEAGGVYVRAGRFAAPYGLRLADHTAYVRRYLGYNLLEETYGVGVGYLADSVEVHATGFVYDPLQGGPRKEAGGALLVEAQPGDSLVIGASARAGVASDNTRLEAGIHGKLWIEGASLLFQAELDGIHESIGRSQLAAYAGPTYVAAKGLYTGIAYQAFAEDLAVHSVLRQGVDAWTSYMPRAHFEIMANARAQRIGPHEHAYLAMLQLHYYL